MPFTRMPYWIKSRAQDWVRLITAALVAQYMLTSPSPRRPAWEAMLMILPPLPPAAIALATA